MHSRPASTIEHALYPIEDTQKLGLLEHVFSEDEFVSAIVFTRTKHRAKRLAQQLSRSGRRAVALQGNMSQKQRDRAMDGFRQRQFDILVATDIAARGIDVAQVSHVVNFDMPNTPDAYTHRIGRTGRAEREGKAYTFVTAADHALVGAVERRIGKVIPRRNIVGDRSMEDRPHAVGGGRLWLDRRGGWAPSTAQPPPLASTLCLASWDIRRFSHGLVYSTTASCAPWYPEQATVSAGCRI